MSFCCLHRWSSPTDRRRTAVGLFICAAAFALGMGSNKGSSGAPLSLKALQAYCGLPRSCDAPVSWQGRSVVVAGRLDPANIFDRRRYPHLPYQKFRLMDDSGRGLEVWVRGANTRPVFEKIARRPSNKAVVNGRLVSIKLHAGAECILGVKMVIEHANQVAFERP